MFERRIPQSTCMICALFILAGQMIVWQISAQELTANLPTDDQRSPAATFEISLKPNPEDSSKVSLTITATIADGWHIYPTNKIGLTTPTEIRFAPIGLTADDDSFELAHPGPSKKELSGTFSWTRNYKVTDKSQPYSGTGSIKFQACDASKCLPPKTLKFILKPDDSPADEGSASYPAINEGEIRLETVTCKKTRPPATFSMSSLFSGPRKDTLDRKCSITIEDQSIDIYLPRTDEYSLENTGSDNTKISNTATYISIDQNGNGILESHEAMPVNLPIRILDSMYVVTDIAKDGSSISLAPSDGPLFGVVVGRKCPEFSFQTVDGSRTISNESILGKVTLLDIWAVT